MKNDPETELQQLYEEYFQRCNGTLGAESLRLMRDEYFERITEVMKRKYDAEVGRTKEQRA